MKLRAKYIVPMTVPPIHDGMIVVADGVIQAVGRAGDVEPHHAGPVRDLGEVVLSPGLINAHAHLEYAPLAGRVPFRGSFIGWIQELLNARRHLTVADYRDAIRTGLEQCVASGTTTLVNVVTNPPAVDGVTAPLRVWWCWELLDFNQHLTPEELLAELTGLPLPAGVVPASVGLAPHALYTVSPGLYRLSAATARQRGWLFTTHVAESDEEDDMIRRGSGLMHDYFRRAGRDMSDCKRAGPVQLLHDYGVWGGNCLAVHANYLAPPEFVLLRRAGTSVVHCPRSHRFFRRGQPLWQEWQRQELNVCLGTDSLASNESLSMLAEMQQMASVLPELPPAEILRLVTLNAARALNQTGRLGCLAPGAAADIIALPAQGTIADLHEAIVYADQLPSFVMVGGKVIRE